MDFINPEKDKVDLVLHKSTVVWMEPEGGGQCGQCTEKCAFSCWMRCLLSVRWLIYAATIFVKLLFCLNTTATANLRPVVIQYL